MLIDTHDPRYNPPEPDPDREPWWERVPWAALKWPAIVCALLLAADLIAGWIGVGLAFTAIYVAAWRVTRLPGAGTLRDYKQ